MVNGVQAWGCRSPRRNANKETEKADFLLQLLQLLLKRILVPQSDIAQYPLVEPGVKQRKQQESGRLVLTHWD